MKFTSQEITAGIMDIVRQHIDIYDLSSPDPMPNMTLKKDLGFDEVDVVDMLIRAEERFGVSIKDDRIGDITVFDLIAMVTEAMREENSSETSEAAVNDNWDDYPGDAA